MLIKDDTPVVAADAVWKRSTPRRQTPSLESYDGAAVEVMRLNRPPYSYAISDDHRYRALAHRIFAAHPPMLARLNKLNSFALFAMMMPCALRPLSPILQLASLLRRQHTNIQCEIAPAA